MAGSARIRPSSQIGTTGRAGQAKQADATTLRKQHSQNIPTELQAILTIVTMFLGTKETFAQTDWRVRNQFGYSIAPIAYLTS